MADFTDDTSVAAAEHRRLFEEWVVSNVKIGNSILLTLEKKQNIVALLKGDKPTSKDPRYGAWVKYNARYGIFQLGPQESLYLKKGWGKIQKWKLNWYRKADNGCDLWGALWCLILNP